MSVEQFDKIDFIGKSSTSETIILTISDHLDWIDQDEHLLILQKKINAYIAFIESGEIKESYPSAKDCSLVIQIYGKYKLPKIGEEFLEEARRLANRIGVDITSKHFGK